MSSPSASPSRTSPEPQENVQIFVKSIAGDTTSLSIPPTTSIATIKSLLAAHPTNPSTSPRTPSANTRLIFSGRHLTTPSMTLADYSIPTNSTLHVAAPLLGGGPSGGGKKKNRCAFKDCKDAAQRIVGDCGFCSGSFCGKHRLLEDHKCEGLEDCKKESHERNKSKLEAERTVVVKGV